MKTIITSLLGILLFQQSQAFCGFYVARSSLDLFNHASQVILAKNGKQLTVTMYSDFHGDPKDFAMVVPVPEVLKRDQIQVIKKDIFNRLNEFTGPRLVKYHDKDIFCTPPPERPVYIRGYASTQVESVLAGKVLGVSVRRNKKYKVKVKERYKIDGYEILILSTKKSKGLELWLKDHGYQIPEGASEVLEPYIKSDMKFFVVKVDMESFKQKKDAYLHPIQIHYTSSRFMLPIRLGMANAKGDQDMIVYAFSKKGRIECSNYQTHEIPSNVDIPLPVASNFDLFYKSLFDKSWEKGGKNGVLLEYGWDISGSSAIKCDPCPSPVLTYAQLKEAGVDWLNNWGGSQYHGKLYASRLHVRYNRSSFPQDLLFQETPNWENFQGRYVLRYPAKIYNNDYSCDKAQDYLKILRNRRQKEVESLTELTDWPATSYQNYIREYDEHINLNSYISPLESNKDKGGIPFPSKWRNYFWYLFLGISTWLFIKYLQRKSSRNLKNINI
ncbi:MAG: DUF2330 domain-containing protein [Bacteroidota bacterium]